MSAPTEAECQKTIIAAANILGYRVAHFRPARTAHGWRTPVQGDAGFPDLCICGHGHLFLVELKRRGNKVSDDQQRWLDELGRTACWSGVVWVPEGQQAFIDALAAHARRAA